MSEEDVKSKVENYWLRAGQVHDAIAIKIEEPIAPAKIPSVMTVSNCDDFISVQLLLNSFYF